MNNPRIYTAVTILLPLLWGNLSTKGSLGTDGVPMERARIRCMTLEKKWEKKDCIDIRMPVAVTCESGGLVVESNASEGEEGIEPLSLYVRKKGKEITIDVQQYEPHPTTLLFKLPVYREFNLDKDQFQFDGIEDSELCKNGVFWTVQTKSEQESNKPMNQKGASEQVPYFAWVKLKNLEDKLTLLKVFRGIRKGMRSKGTNNDDYSQMRKVRGLVKDIFDSNAKDDKADKSIISNDTEKNDAKPADEVKGINEIANASDILNESIIVEKEFPIINEIANANANANASDIESKSIISNEEEIDANQVDGLEEISDEAKKRLIIEKNDANPADELEVISDEEECLIIEKNDANLAGELEVISNAKVDALEELKKMIKNAKNVKEALKIISVWVKKVLSFT